MTVDELVERIQRALFVHPIAAKALYRTLLEEGRRAAATPEGQALAERLAASELVHRARIVWDVASLRMLDDDPDTPVPTAMIDSLVELALSDAMEPQFASLMDNVDPE